MKKRKMLSLALVFALIMSLVPVSGLAAEPSVFMDPGAVMQEDAEEAVSTEAANAENGEELFSPDMDEAEGQVSGEASGETEILTGEPGADHAFEEEPVPEDMGADQALEGETAAEPVEEETGADQAVSEEAPEEEPAAKDSGADQAFREEPAGALAGKKLTNIRYYLKDRIIDLSVDLGIPVLTSAVTLDKTSVSMLEGRTAVLTASVEPDGTFWPLYWSSSNENVVGVDQNGILTAVAAGTATITAEAADNTGVSAVCQVTVTKPVSAITLDKTSASVLAGKTVAIKATVKPDDAGNKAVSWTSSDQKIATVTQKGVVKGIKRGTVTITAAAKDGSGKKVTCKVTVQ